jgi:CRISPR/Cas system-associated exonuclease Cas4 (RecB family)
MAIINLKLNGADANKLLLLCEQDVRFVAAKTLTQTAQIAQTEIKKHLHETFVLRKPNFEKSIKIRPANKQDMTATIYTMAGFAALQQTGGKQTAISGRLAVPKYDSLSEIKAGRKSNPAGSFLVQTKSGARFIATRNGTEMRVLYYLKSLAYMPKRLNMVEITEDMAIKHVPQIFSKNLSQL